MKLQVGKQNIRKYNKIGTLGPGFLETTWCDKPDLNSFFLLQSFNPGAKEQEKWKETKFRS